jgi:tellurite resistance protein
MRRAHHRVTFFAIGVGLMGLTLAIRSAEHAFSLTNTGRTAALVLSVTMLIAIAIGFDAKAAIHTTEVKAEWNHPVHPC